MTDGDLSELCVFNLAASGMSLAFGEVTGSHIARGLAMAVHISQNGDHHDHWLGT